MMHLQKRDLFKISEEEFLKTRCIEFSKAWQWNPTLNKFEKITTPVLKALRDAREVECFSLMNKSPLWFMSLSPAQQKELTDWYKAWLDVTEIQEIPEKPTWLK
jgi:hypothetical protein